MGNGVSVREEKHILNDDYESNIKKEDDSENYGVIALYFLREMLKL